MSRASSIQTSPAWAIGHCRRSRRAPSTIACGFIAARQRAPNWRNGLKHFVALLELLLQPYASALPHSAPPGKEILGGLRSFLSANQKFEKPESAQSGLR